MNEDKYQFANVRLFLETNECLFVFFTLLVFYVPFYAVEGGNQNNDEDDANDETMVILFDSIFQLVFLESRNR